MVGIDSSHLLRGKILCFSTRSLMNNQHRTTTSSLSLDQMKFRVPRTLAFDSSRGKGEARSCSRLEATFGDNASTECTLSFDFPESKVELPHLESEAHLSGSNGDNNVASVINKLNALRSHLLVAEKWNASQIHLCDRKYLECATNLVHYMALRSLDIEQLNSHLESLGLSSLDNNNLDVLSSLNASISLLMNNSSYNDHKAVTESWNNAFPKSKSTKKNDKGKVSSHKESLLGKVREGRRTHIMVTVGEEATLSETFITDIVKAGTSIIRINCAHGDPSISGEIIKRFRRASQMLEMPCRVHMDLGGPKLRTGTLKPGPCVMKVSPKKDGYGNVVSPAVVWLSLTGTEPPAHVSPDAAISVQDEDFLAGLQLGDSVRLRNMIRSSLAQVNSIVDCFNFFTCKF